MTKNEIISAIKETAAKHGFTAEESSWYRWPNITEQSTHYLNFTITDEYAEDTDWSKREVEVQIHSRLDAAGIGGRGGEHVGQVIGSYAEVEVIGFGSNRRIHPVDLHARDFLHLLEGLAVGQRVHHGRGEAAPYVNGNGLRGDGTLGFLVAKVLTVDGAQIFRKGERSDHHKGKHQAEQSGKFLHGTDTLPFLFSAAENKHKTDRRFVCYYHIE